MKISGSYTVPGRPARIYDALTDPVILKQCISGCEALDKIAEDTYEARIKIGVGGLSDTYTGRAELRDRTPSQSFTLVVSGRGGPGSIRSSARFALASVGDDTRIDCETDLQVGGLMAAFGSRLIEGLGRKQMDDFFRQFAARIGDEPSSAA